METTLAASKDTMLQDSKFIQKNQHSEVDKTLQELTQGGPGAPNLAGAMEEIAEGTKKDSSMNSELKEVTDANPKDHSKREANDAAQDEINEFAEEGSDSTSSLNERKAASQTTKTPVQHFA